MVAHAAVRIGRAWDDVRTASGLRAHAFVREDMGSLVWEVQVEIVE
jgi:hypothetical protein